MNDFGFSPTALTFGGGRNCLPSHLHWLIPPGNDVLWIAGSCALLVVGFVGMRRSPTAGLMVWFALLPVQFDTVSSLGFRFAPADVVLLGLLAGALLRGTVGFYAFRQVPGVLGWLGLFLMWIGVCAFVAYLHEGELSRYAFFNKFVGLASLVASFLLIVGAGRGPDRISRDLALLCVIGSAAIALLAFYLSDSISGLQIFVMAPQLENRLRGLLLDPNAYGGYVAAIAVLQICLLTGRLSRKARIVGGGNVLLLFVGLNLANSRSAWIGLLCGLAALVWQLPAARRRQLVLFGVILGLVGIGFALPTIGMFQTGYESHMREAALNYRVQLTLAALHAWMSSPVWGVGLGLFEAAPGHKGYMPHSTYMWLLAESGITGMILMLTWMGATYRSSLRFVARRSDQGLPHLVLVSTLCCWLGLMIGIEALYQRHYWFLVAFSLGSSVVAGGQVQHQPPTPQARRQTG